MSLGHTSLVLVVYVLAVMRLTRLVTDDTILDPFRIRVSTRYGPGSTVVYFLGCPWCVGLWISVGAAAAPAALLDWPWWTVLPLGLACSQLTGMAAPLYRDDEIEFEPVDAS